jgi:hypothetical protein
VIWWFGGSIIIGFALGLGVALARAAKQADEHAAALAARAIAKCDYPLCHENATVTLNVNGTILCSCEKHPSLLVRLHAGEPFEAFGVLEKQVIA